MLVSLWNNCSFFIAIYLYLRLFCCPYYYIVLFYYIHWCKILYLSAVNILYKYMISDMTSAPPPSKQHSCSVPLHPGVCVSRVIASSSKPDHFDIKAEVCCSLFTLRRMSWENDPARGWSSLRTMWSHLRGVVSAFLCLYSACKVA